MIKMISNLDYARKTRRITRAIAKKYTELTWVDEPLFWRNRIENTNANDKGLLCHRWGVIGDSPVLTKLLKDYISHKTEEEFRQCVHNLVCKMLKSGYLEYSPETRHNPTYSGKITDVGAIELIQRDGSTVKGGHLALSQMAYHLPANDLILFIRTLRSNSIAISVFFLTVLQVIELLSNLGILDRLKTTIEAAIQ